VTVQKLKNYLREAASMARIEKHDGTIEIACPFCEKLLVRDYDLAEMDEDEEERLPDPIWDIQCPHVAACCVWGFLDPEVTAMWRAEVEEVCRKLGEELGECSPEDLFDYFGDDDNLVTAIESCDLPNITIKVVKEFICKNQGVKGDGGPTFMIVLMNRIPEFG
jgi:hypothetical protein